MQPKPSFTGRSRRRTTHPWVRASDTIARAVITLGGIGTIEGPIIGTIVYFLLREFLADFGTLYLLFLGTLAIVVMLAAPKGLWGYAAERFGWSLFPVGYRIYFKE